VARLERELDIINQMGFPGYFLIVMDFIRWARENDIPVGPGRGSGAGSLVAYALEITDLDPLEYDLLFERFLNPERVSMPDFDIDFCMENRDRVIASARSSGAAYPRADRHDQQSAR
jgi:DNA polymerase-3 subunit alpha